MRCIKWRPSRVEEADVGGGEEGADVTAGYVVAGVSRPWSPTRRGGAHHRIRPSCKEEMWPWHMRGHRPLLARDPASTGTWAAATPALPSKAYVATPVPPHHEPDASELHAKVVGGCVLPEE